MSDVAIRKMEVADFHEVCNLAQLNFPNVTPDVITEEFSTSFNEYQRAVYTTIVAEKDNKIIGIAAMVKPIFFGFSRGICFLCVDENYRKQGVAKILVKYLENLILNWRIPEGEAWAIVSAVPASQKIFRNLGYIGDTPGPNGGVIMTKRLRSQ